MTSVPSPSRAVTDAICFSLVAGAILFGTHHRCEFSLQPHRGQDLVHAGIGAQVLPGEGMSDQNHGADTGLDGSFQPLDRLVGTTEGGEGDREVDMESELRAYPLQLLELRKVAQCLLRPARPRREARLSAK